MGREMELINKYANPQIFPKFYAIALIYNISPFLPEQMKVIVCLSVTQHSSLEQHWAFMDRQRQGGRVHNWEMTYRRTHLPVHSTCMDRKNFKPQLGTNNFLHKSPEFPLVCICLKHAPNWTGIGSFSKACHLCYSTPTRDSQTHSPTSDSRAQCANSKTKETKHKSKHWAYVKENGKTLDV